MFGLKLLYVGISFFLLQENESDWKKSLDKDGVVIYTRSIESSKFKETLAKAEMQGTIEKFKEIFLDVDSYKDWMPDCKSAEIIEHSHPNELTYYMKLKVPFPFSNRDIVQQLVIDEAESQVTIILNNCPDKVGLEKKYVRMQKAYGQWLVKNIGDNKVSIRFQYLADPGGDIPSWLVNSFIVKSPHTTILRIKEKMAD